MSSSSEFTSITVPLRDDALDALDAYSGEQKSPPSRARTAEQSFRRTLTESVEPGGRPCRSTPRTTSATPSSIGSSPPARRLVRLRTETCRTGYAIGESLDDLTETRWRFWATHKNGL
jgi:hypothetical protein